MKHKTKGFIAMILALCLMMSLGIGALADNSGQDESGNDEGGGYQPSGDAQDPNETVTQKDETQTGDNQPTIYSVTIADGLNDLIMAKPTSAASNTPVTLTIYNTRGGINYRYTTDSLKVTDSNGQPVTVTGSGNSFSFTLTDNVTVSGEFKQLYSVSAGTAPTGFTIISSVSEAAEGDTVTVNVNGTVPDGRELVVKANSVTCSGSSGSYSFTMPAEEVTVTATFKQTEQPEPDQPKTYTVTYLASPYYNVAGLQRSYEADADVTFSVTPVTNYSITSVSSTDVDITNKGNGSYSFTMPETAVNINITCRYTGPMTGEYNIDTYSNSAYSGVALITGDTAKWGDTVKFRIYDAYRYDYYNVYVYTKSGDRIYPNYNATNDYYSFSMPDEDVKISVYFDRVGTYSITKDVEGDGSIYVRSSADHGDTVWIEAAPNAGQSLTSLRVFYGEPWAYGDKGYYGYWDEAEVKYSTYWDAYYFTMPADDVVVYARFTDGATVDVITGDHGDAKVSSRYADKGDWVYITAYPDEGYEVDSVTVTDSLGRSVKVTELSYDYFLFTMPGTNVDVKVTFRVKDYDVFYDVSRGDWYYKAVRFVHEKGIMEGTGTHYFSPEADLSRGMLATILYRLEGSPSVSGYSGFSDVADTAYYAKAVAWAKANGIVNGVTATAYEPDTAVTREELAAILCRYAAFKGKDTAISYDYLAGFSDANTSHVYARPALNWAVAYDIINGQGNGVLAPRATATRAEVAQVLMNYLEVFD